MNRTQYKIFSTSLARQQGFSLFELMVYILLVSIVFSVAMRRFESFPGEAERANFLAINMQLRAGVNLQMMNAIASGSWDDLERLENSNPMALMLETPTNYVGEFSVVDEMSMPRRTWYFDTYNGHLVYLVNDNSRLYSTAGDGTSTLSSIRLRIALRYADEKPGEKPGLGIDVATVTGLRDAALRSSAQGGGSAGREWQGLVLEAVTPYRWNSGDLSIPSGQAAR